MSFSLTDVKNLYEKVDGFLNPDPPPFARTTIDNANNRNASKINEANEKNIGFATHLSKKENISSDIKSLNGYKILHYPDELLNTSAAMGNRYPHAMFFFINVSSKSLVGSSAKNKTILDIEGNVLDLTSRTQGSGVATSFNIDKAPKVSSDGGTKLTATRNRSIACIMLPIPLNVQAAYNIGYGQGGVDGVLGALVANAASGGISGVMDVLTSSETVGGIVKEVGKQGLKLGEGVLNSLGTKGGSGNNGFGDTFGKTQNLSGIMDKIEGTMKNPRKEQIFSGVDFRTFNFSWNIPIRSTGEWISIRKIISLFKKHMHPELQAGSSGSYLVLPDEFDIQFYEKTSDKFSESKTLPKIATSVIESLQVNYTPQGSWVAFEGTMIPPFVQISMTIKELEPLVRSMVADVTDVITDVEEHWLSVGDKNKEQINKDNAKFRGF